MSASGGELFIHVYIPFNKAGRQFKRFESLEEKKIAISRVVERTDVDDGAALAINTLVYHHRVRGVKRVLTLLGTLNIVALTLTMMMLHRRCVYVLLSGQASPGQQQQINRYRFQDTPATDGERRARERARSKDNAHAR